MIQALCSFLIQVSKILLIKIIILESIFSYNENIILYLFFIVFL